MLNFSSSYFFVIGRIIEKINPSKKVMINAYCNPLLGVQYRFIPTQIVPWTCMLVLIKLETHISIRNVLLSCITKYKPKLICWLRDLETPFILQLPLCDVQQLIWATQENWYCNKHIWNRRRTSVFCFFQNCIFTSREALTFPHDLIMQTSYFW